MPQKSIVLLAVLILGGGFAPASSAADAAGDTRLRDTLRSTIQALNTAESDRAALQSAEADDQKRIVELNSQVQVLIKRSLADKSAADQAAAALAARLADREREVAELRRSLAKAEAGARAQAAALTEGEREHVRLAADNLALQRHLAEVKAKNAALFKTANEILTRYEHFGLGNALAAKEPFVGTTRVKLENQVQDYEDKLLDQRSGL